MFCIFLNKELLASKNNYNFFRKKAIDIIWNEDDFRFDYGNKTKYDVEHTPLTYFNCN